MMFRGGGEIAPPRIAWRRPSLGEAFLTVCCVFTISMTLQILFYAASQEAINYEKAFFYAACFGVGYGVSSLLWKSRMVILR
ncbi:hypothetical protein ACPVPU_08850 [Sphingomonas sp. CJ99]